MTNGDFRIIVKAALDKVVSLGQIQKDLDELSSQLSLKVKINLDTTAITALKQSIEGISTKSLNDNLKADVSKIESSLNETNKKIREAQQARAAIMKEFRDNEKAEDDKFWNELKNNPVKRPLKGQDMYAEYKQNINQGLNKNYFSTSGDTLDEKAQFLKMSGADELLQKIAAGRKKFDEFKYNNTDAIKSLDAEIASLTQLNKQTEISYNEAKLQNNVIDQNAESLKKEAAQVQNLTSGMEKLVNVARKYNDEDKITNETLSYRNTKTGNTTKEHYSFDEEGVKSFVSSEVGIPKEKLEEAKVNYDKFIKDMIEKTNKLAQLGVPTEQIAKLNAEIINLESTSSKLDFNKVKNEIEAAEQAMAKDIAKEKERIAVFNEEYKIKEKLAALEKNYQSFATNVPDRFDKISASLTGMDKEIVKVIHDLEQLNGTSSKEDVSGVNKKITDLEKLASIEKNYYKDVDFANYAAYEEKSKREKNYMGKLVQDQSVARDNALKEDAAFNAKREAIETDVANRKLRLLDQIGQMQRKYGNSVDNAGLEDLKQKINLVNSSTVNWKGEINNLTHSMNEFGIAAKTSGSHTLGIGEAFQKALVKFPVWMVATTVFYQSLHFFTDGIKYVNELNATLTQISTAVNYNKDQVAALGVEYNKLAIQMSVTTKEMSQGALEYYRQGLGDKQVIENLKTTTMYAKISGLEFKQSAEVLTAATASMKVDINKVSDVFTLLGDLTATSASEIGIAFEKVGGTAYSLKIPFDKVASYIATISAQTRESAETVGSSVKAIFSRIGSVKEKGFDSEDGTTVNQVAKALHAANIELVSANGQFRNFSTVLDELGGRWRTLDDRTQRYIATTVAGTYQQSRFLTLMDNYGKSVSLYEQAVNAAGTSTSKYNLYLQGTQAHIDNLKARLEQLWSDSFKSDGINLIVDLLGKMVSGIGSVVHAFGLLPVILGAVTASLLLFNKGAMDFTKNIIPSMLGGNGKLATEFKTMGISAIFAGEALAGLRATMMSLLISTGIGAIVAGIGWALTSLVSAIGAHNAKVKEATTISYDNVNSLVTQKKALEEVANEYSSLKDADIAGTATIDQKKRLLEIQQELVSKYGVSVSGINAEGQAYSDSIPLIVARTKALQDQIDTENRSNKTKLIAKDTQSNDEISNNSSKLDKAKKSLEDYQKQLVEFEKRVQTGRVTNSDNFLPDVPSQLDVNIKDNADSIQNIREGLNYKVNILQKDFQDANIKLQDSMKDRTQVLNNEATQYIKSLVDSGAKISDQQRLFVKNIVDSFAKDGKHLDVQIEEIRTAIDKLKNSNFNKVLDDFNKAASNGDQGQMNEAKKQVLLLLDSIVSSTPNMEDFKAKILDMFKVPDGNQAKDKVSELIAKMNELKGSVDTTAKSVEPLNILLQDMANGKQINANAVSKLMDSEKGLANAITVENGVIHINKTAVENLRDAKIAAIEDPLKKMEIALKAQEDALVQELKMYGVQIDSIQQVANAKSALLGQQKTYDDNQKKAADGFKNGTYSFSPDALGLNYAENMNRQKALADIDAVKQAHDALKGLQVDLIDLKTSNKSEKAPAAKDNTASETKRDMNEFARMNRELDDQIVLSQDHMASVLDTSKKYRDELQKQIPIYDKKQALAHQEADSLRGINVELKHRLDTEDLNKSQQNSILNQIDANENAISKLGHSWFEYGKSATEANAKVLASLDKQSKFRYDNSKQWIESEAKQNELDGKDKLTILQAKLISQLRSASYGDLSVIEQKKANADVIQTKIDLDSEYYAHYEKLIKDKKDIDKLTIQDEINEYKKLGAYYTVGSEGRIKADKAVHDAQKALLDKTEKEYKDSIKKIQSIEDDRHKDVIENLDAERTKFDSSVDEEIKAKDRANQSIDFQDVQSEKLKQQADLNNQLALLNLRSDLDAKAEKIKVQEELDKLNKDIAKDTRNRDAQIVKDGLTDRKDKYDKDIEASKKAEDLKHEAIKASLQAILDDEKTWAALSKSVFDGNTTAIATSFDTLGQAIGTVLATIGTGLANNLTKPLTDAINLAKTGLDTSKGDLGSNSGSSSTPSIPESTTPIVPSTPPVAAPISTPVAKPAPTSAAPTTWQENLARAAIDDAYALSEIKRAQDVYNADKAIGDMVGAEAAHRWADQIREANPRVPRYKDGGKVEHTGLAWVDGTKSNPEYMLSAENFKTLLPAINLASGIIDKVKSIKNDIGNIINRKDNDKESRPNITIGTMFNVDKMDANSNLEVFAERFINRIESVTGMKIRTSN